MNVRGERWPWIMRLAGAVVIILNLAACGTPAEGTTVNIVGARGQYIWAVTGSRFFVSSDAGAHWSSTAVPSGVVGTKTDALVSPTGALWLLNTNQNIASFSYALGSGESWSTTRTTLTWPGPAPKGRGAGGAILGSNGPGVVSAVVSDNNGNLAPAVLILVSSDGKAFQEHAPPITSGDLNVAFISPTTGVVAGDQKIYYTTDGGSSWHPAVLPGADQSGAMILGIPLVSGPRIYVTASFAFGSGWRLVLYVSTNGGKSFAMSGSVTRRNPLSGTQINTNQDDNTTPGLGVDGANIWMLSAPPNVNAIVYTSSDGGTDWKPVSSPQLNNSLPDIGLTSASDATVWVTPANCNGSACNKMMLLATSDGGRSWQRAPLPPVK